MIYLRLKLIFLCCRIHTIIIIIIIIIINYFIFINYYYWGRSVIGISRSLIWSKTTMELIFNPVVNFGKVRRAQLAKSTSSPPRWCPWDLFRFFKVCSNSKERERGCGKQRKLPHLSIPGKTAALVPEFVVEDLPFGRTAA